MTNVTLSKFSLAQCLEITSEGSVVLQMCVKRCTCLPLYRLCYIRVASSCTLYWICLVGI